MAAAEGRVYLTGFMGAGKTAVGHRLAETLGCDFVDLDDWIEARAGKPVRQIFAEDGEPAFRRLEHACLERTAEMPAAVVALGGGTFTFEGNRAFVAEAGVSVWLDPSFATIVRRIGDEGKAERPLFGDETEAFALYRERLPAYGRADLHVSIGSDETSAEVAARIALLLRGRSCAT